MRLANNNDAQFTGTRWSLILQAADSRLPDAARALEELCRAYWYPVYAFVRRQGTGEEEAKDLTQSFFLHVLETKLVAAADQTRGRFRTFLIHSLRHFLADEHKRASAQKRGGDAQLFFLDGEEGENRYREELAHDATPESLFERKWAKTVVKQVMQALEMEYRKAGQMPRFRVFMSCLAADNASPSHSEAGALVGMTESSFRTAFHRFRRRYGELFRHEIARLVDNPVEIDEEIQHIVGLLRH
jgi:RNA polymerase sigma factor (sigma-70 family)